MAVMRFSFSFDYDDNPTQPRVVSVSEPHVVSSRPDWYHALIAMGLTKDDPPPGVCWRLACTSQSPRGRYFCCNTCANVVRDGMRRWKAFTKRLTNGEMYENLDLDGPLAALPGPELG